MMRRPVLAVLAAVLWPSSAWTATCDIPGGPGAGGNFTSVDVSASGAVMAGGDVSGLYRKTSTSGSSWIKVGSLDGFNATIPHSIRYLPSNPSIIVVGSGNGVFRSTDSGQSFSTVGNSVFGDDNVSAIGVMRSASTDTSDNDVVVACWRTDESPSSSQTIKLAISENYGSTWTEVSSPGLPSVNAGTDSNRVPIKVWLDPHQRGASRHIYVLFGEALGGKARELWRSQSNGTSFERIAPRGNHTGGVDGPFDPIDMVWRMTAGNRIAMVSCSNDDDTADGKIYRYWPASSPLWLQTPTPSYSTGNPPVTKYVTGALFTDGSAGYYYAVMTKYDACSGGARVDKDGPGIYRKTYNNSVPPDPDSAGAPAGGPGGWHRIDSGKDWEVGWNTCSSAMGAPLSEAVSSALSSDGKFWVTPYHVWRYTTGPTRFVRDFSSNTKGWTWSGGNPIPAEGVSRGIDNVNVAAILPTTTENNVWVGFYDIGLWKWDGSKWVDRNPVGNDDWTEGNGGSSDSVGGNVNGILSVGSTLYVTESPSSKSRQWRLWYSTDGGATWNIKAPTSGWSYADGNTYLRCLHKDPNSSYYWITVNGNVYYSTDAATWTQASGLPGGSVLTIHEVGGTAIAGGWGGLYKATFSGGSWGSFTSVDSLGGYCCGSSGKPGYGPYSTSGGRSGQPYSDEYHEEKWYGVHQVLKHHDNWYAVVYLGSGEGGDAYKYGLLQSTNGGGAWSTVYKNTLRRGLAVNDSCDAGYTGRERFALTSGEGFSSGPNSTSDLDDGDGLEFLRNDSGQKCATCADGWVVRGVVRAGDCDVTRTPLGARVAMSLTDNSVYYGSPGWGFALYYFPAVGECETQLGGGGGQTALGVLEAAPRVRYAAGAFKLSGAGKLRVFDLLGREVADLRAERAGEVPWTGKPGMYFARFRSGEREASVRFVILR